MSRFLNRVLTNKRASLPAHLTNPGGESSSSNTNDLPNFSCGLSLRSTEPPGYSPYPQELGTAEEYYRLCRALVIQLSADGAGNKLATEVEGDEAQCMADFLKEVSTMIRLITAAADEIKMLDDEQVPLSQRERKYTLHLLVKLAKSAHVFPQSFELHNVQCNLGMHITGGGFGLIYKGIYEGKSVCVKAVHVPEGGIENHKLRAHSGELVLSAHLSHTNVLPFSGIYFSDEAPPRVCIVSPWMENGDLLHYMQRNPNIPHTLFVHDIISGLKYLHDLDIVHADLKAQNVLISAAGRAMLADFGISRVAVTTAATTANNGSGTINWVAPELFLEEGVIANRESDIWAFGCVCYEIITGGMMPFHQLKTLPLLIGAFMRGQIIPLKPTSTQDKEWDSTKEHIWSVGEQCWKRDPQSRPTAEELERHIASLDFSDGRPAEPVSSKTETDSKIDYYQIFDILYRIRNSSRGMSNDSASLNGSATTFEEELIRQFMKVRQRVQCLYSENQGLRVYVGEMEERATDERIDFEQKLRECEEERTEVYQRLKKKLATVEQELEAYKKSANGEHVAISLPDREVKMTAEERQRRRNERKTMTAADRVKELEEELKQVTEREEKERNRGIELRKQLMSQIARAGATKPTRTTTRGHSNTV